MRNNVTGAAGGKFFIFKFFLQAFHFHVLRALRGTHLRGRADKARQFVGGKKDFFHQVLRFDVNANTVTVTTNGMDKPGRCVDFRQESRRLFAMFFRVFFKIHVMQKTDEAPPVSIAAVTEFAGVPLHDAFHRECMQNVKRFLIILL